MLSLQVAQTDDDDDASSSRARGNNEQEEEQQQPRNYNNKDINHDLITRTSHLLPTYGSCPSSFATFTQQQQQEEEHRSSTPPPSWLLSNFIHMGSTSTEEEDSFPVATVGSNNNSSPPPSTSSPTAAAQTTTSPTTTSVTNTDSSDIQPVENDTTIELDEENTTTDSTTSSNKLQTIIMTTTTTITTILTPIINRLLQQPVAADTLLIQYQILTHLSQNGKYAMLGFLAIYLLLTLILWMPLWILSQLISEMGVYTFLFVGLVYGGRCLLRLLAFPGTNVRVYGEIENEFAKYSCKMLEGGAGAMEDFAKSLRSAGGRGRGKSSKLLSSSNKAILTLGLDENDGWEIVDVPSTYQRVLVYKKRILGVYYEVLHCLLEENGQGYYDNGPNDDTIGTTTATNGNTNNGFYRLGGNVSAACKDTCKRNLLCCERKSDTTDLNSSSDTIEGMVGQPMDNNTKYNSPSNGGSFHGERTIMATTTTQYGNNPLIGDIGNMGNLTSQARSDGRELYTLLNSLLNDLSMLESSASHVLRISKEKNKKDELKNATISEETVEHATKLMQRAAELREFVTRIKLPSAATDSDGNEDEQQHDEESDVGAEAVRHRLEEQGTASSSSSTMGMVWSVVQAFISMVDPPPHKSIFGLDVIRGTFLARYHGAKQFWVKRSGDGCSGSGGEGRNGKLDVIMIPSSSTPPSNGKDSSIESMLPLSPRKGRGGEPVSPFSSVGGGGGGGGGGDNNNVGGNKKRRAVLYCNPNAGLVEVATGMGLTGGNVDQDEDDDEKEPTCWTEYYIEHGYDVFLFNYAGYGRSFGGSSWNETTTEFSHGILGALKRVLFSTFLAFKPSSESLKSDAAAVARHLVDVVGVDELIIHGESIGGMAAAGAARALTATKATTTTAIPKLTTLLICDRTFCNLEAVAQRLVGQWTGNAIRLLTPSWSTDVARDFLAAKCPKICANDCADEIIHDYSSLKAGLSFAGELTK
ncbi:hypothetical protein ACHAXR_005101, partial [Thalassiosira sp. AJA248-18]